MTALNRFTLFEFAPKVEWLEGIEKRSVPQKCTKGHSWDVGFELSAVRLDLSAFGFTDGVEEYCLLCLRDTLREHWGRVKPA